jgi:hypothetical protein
MGGVGRSFVITASLFPILLLALREPIFVKSLSTSQAVDWKTDLKQNMPSMLMDLKLLNSGRPAFNEVFGLAIHKTKYEARPNVNVM